MQTLFVSPISLGEMLNHAAACDDEMDRRIEIKHFFAGALSPCFVKFDAAGMGHSGGMKVVTSIVDAFIRPRVMLAGDNRLCHYFSIDTQLVEQRELEEFARQFSLSEQRASLVIDLKGRFAGQMVALVLFFDEDSKQLANEWVGTEYDFRVLNLDSELNRPREPKALDENAA